MTVKRLDNIGIFVDDLQAAVDFFVELGLELQGTQSVEGRFLDDTTGLDGAACEIAILVTPDGHSKLELAEFVTPRAVEAPELPVNGIGLRKLMFAVDDIHDTIRRLERHGAELLGTVANYEDIFLLCYLRGPGGTIVALAEELAST